MPRSDCVLCLKRIESNQKSIRAGQEHIWTDLRLYVEMVKPERKVNTESRVCQKCRGCIRRFIKNQIPLEEDIVEDSEPLDTSEVLAEESEMLETPQLMPPSSEESVIYESEAINTPPSEILVQDSETIYPNQSLQIVPESEPVFSQRSERFQLDSEFRYSEVLDHQAFEDLLETPPSNQNSLQLLENEGSEDLFAGLYEESMDHSEAISVVNSSVVSLSQTSTVFVDSIKVCASSEKCCMVCKSKNGRILVPGTAVRQVWMTRAIIIPEKNRCCRDHLKDGRFTKESLLEIQPARTGVRMSSKELGDWIMHLTDSSRFKINFATGDITDDQ